MLVSRNERRQLQEIGNTKVRASCRYGHKRITCGQACPRRGQAPQLARVIVEIDALLTPGAALFYEPELTPRQRMELMSDPDPLRSIERTKCS